MISKITEKYRTEQDMNRAEFGRALSENISQSVSRQSVHQWESDQHAPAVDLLILIAMRYKDWRFDWAMECLHVLKPELYQPVMEAWK